MTPSSGSASGEVPFVGARLESLTDAILVEIINQVSGLGPWKVGWSTKAGPDLKNLSLVSKRLRTFCAPALFRRLLVATDGPVWNNYVATPPHFVQCLSTIMTDLGASSVFTACVRYLDLSQIYQSKPNRYLSTNIVRAIQSLPNLTELCIDQTAIAKAEQLLVRNRNWYLPKLSGLRVVIYAPRLSEKMGTFILRCSALKKLAIWYMAGDEETEGFLDDAPPVGSLEHLAINSPVLWNTSPQRLARLFPALDTLVLHANWRCSCCLEQPLSVPGLEHFSMLRRLVFDDNLHWQNREPPGGAADRACLTPAAFTWRPDPHRNSRATQTGFCKSSFAQCPRLEAILFFGSLAPCINTFDNEVNERWVVRYLAAHGDGHGGEKPCYSVARKCIYDDYWHGENTGEDSFFKP